jgi:hypothetical protein
VAEGAGTPTRRRGRSPAYPGIDLETAVQRAGQLYDRERLYASPVETVAQHWGYKSLNGPASVAISALKKFGLVVDEGSGSDRKVRVTDLAIEILQNPSGEARKAAKKEAALSPTIHRELWEQYGPVLPSDASLRWELTRGRGFTDTGADEFIPEYRATMQFAELAEAELSEALAHTPTAEESPSQQEEYERPASVTSLSEVPTRDADAGRTRDRASTTYTIPLPKNAGVVELSAKFPLTESEWKYFMTLLEALKPGLVDDSAN